jgi:hypothetical protein
MGETPEHRVDDYSSMVLFQAAPWDCLVDGIIQYINCTHASVVRIIFHISEMLPSDTSYVRVKHNRFRQYEKEIKRKVDEREIDIQVWGTHTMPESCPIWDVISQIPRYSNQLGDFVNSLMKKLEEVNSEEEKKKKLEDISVLKHCIVNLFEPTNFDLESVRIDINTSGDNATAWTLLQRFFSVKRGKNYYQNLLNRTYYLALGEQEKAWMKMLDEAAETNLNEWKRTEGALPDEQAALDLVRKEDQEGNAEWEKLYKLLGLQQENDEYIPNETSPIRLFCKQMDSLKDNPPDKAPSIWGFLPNAPKRWNKGLRCWNSPGR